MKTLVIAPFSPYPLVFGGAIRLYHLLKMFSTVSDVSLLAYRSWSEDGDNVGDLDTFCKEVVLVDEHPLSTRRKWMLQARSSFGTCTFQYFSHYSQSFQRQLTTLVRRQEFDYIVTSFSQMAYFRLPRTNALRVLDLHNIEYELLARRAQVEHNPVKKAMLWLEAKKFQRDEIALCKEFDLVLAPSERERNQLRAMLPSTHVECLPNSINTEYFALRDANPVQNEILFVGTTHVDANRDGVCYFMEEIFPLIEQHIPNVRFTIVGGDPPPRIREFGRRSNVEVTGYVKDVRPYMQRAKIMVVPLRVGGGTRLKVLEGLSFGVPTVSTTLGSEGIAVRDGDHLLLADTPEAFAGKVVGLMQDNDLQNSLRVNGRRLVEQEYSWRAVGKKLAAYLPPRSTGDALESNRDSCVSVGGA